MRLKCLFYIKRNNCYSSDETSVFHNTKSNRIFILFDLIVLSHIFVNKYVLFQLLHTREMSLSDYFFSLQAVQKVHEECIV